LKQVPGGKGATAAPDERRLVRSLIEHL
jgi:hypothetical protein